jgi:rubrerythrin
MGGLTKPDQESPNPRRLSCAPSMGGVKDTKQNLQAAIDGERYEFKDMYPDFIQEAEAAGNRAAATSFRHANVVEEIHHGLYTEALDTLAAGKDLPAAAIHVCDVCGNTVVGEAPDKCPVCGAPKATFKEVV